MVLSRLFCVLLFFCAFPLWSQEFNQAAKHAVIERLADMLRQGYVSESVGNQMADHLLAREKEQAYAPITDPALFANRLTEDLLGIAHDKHLRIRFNDASAEVTQNPETELADSWKRRQQNRERNNGYAAVKILEGNIGYVEVTGFPPAEIAKPQVDAAFLLLQDVEALILDLRRNGGGDPTGVAYLCSYLLPENVHLNTLRFRNQPDLVTRTVAVTGKRLLDVPVYVLTSGETFSGGEECSYDLQTQKRATLIGETTGGGANPGDNVPLGQGFTCFLPGGMAVNPITGTNWEGVGVVPEVPCAAADALAIAQERAAEKIKTAREARLAQYLRFNQEIAALLVKSDTEDAASYEALLSALKQGVASGETNEGEINALGYRHLRDQPARAERLFRINIALFPSSSNTYDSYGEALAARGKRDEAIAAYTKAIETAKAQGQAGLVELHQQGLARLTQ